MVKKYGDLYLLARRALLTSEGDNASMAARELLALASDKSVSAVLADSGLYASEQIEERLDSYVARISSASGTFTGCRLRSRRMC